MGTLTLSLHLNHPQFVFLRTKLAGGLQLGVFLNDVHDFLDEVPKRVLKKTSPTTKTDKYSRLLREHGEDVTVKYLYSLFDLEDSFYLFLFEILKTPCHEFGGIQVCADLRCRSRR